MKMIVLKAFDISLKLAVLALTGSKASNRKTEMEANTAATKPRPASTVPKAMPCVISPPNSLVAFT